MWPEAHYQCFSLPIERGKAVPTKATVADCLPARANVVWGASSTGVEWLLADGPRRVAAGLETARSNVMVHGAAFGVQ